jgi:hypothetical protein
MADRVLRTDWKRVGRSGPTVDGRTISPQMIDEMAASYDKTLFTALIWPEHQRYVNYGTVEELRATDNEEGGRDLWAILSPNSFYTSSNQYGQKLFTSMEITPDFRKSGKAYLSGLGATDDPASAATSEIRLSKTAAEGGIILTSAVESVDKTFEDPAPQNLLDQIKALFTHQDKDNDMADKAEIQNLKSELAELKTLFAKMKPDTTTETEPTADDKCSQLATKVQELTTKVEQAVAAFARQAPETDKDKTAIQDLSEKLEKFGQKLEAALKEQPGTNGGEHFGNEGGDLSSYI